MTLVHNDMHTYARILCCCICQFSLRFCFFVLLFSLCMLGGGSVSCFYVTHFCLVCELVSSVLAKRLAAIASLR